MHIYPAKSPRCESTGFASVMIDDVGCSRRIYASIGLNELTNITTDKENFQCNG